MGLTSWKRGEEGEGGDGGKAPLWSGWPCQRKLAEWLAQAAREQAEPATKGKRRVKSSGK